LGVQVFLYELNEVPWRVVDHYIRFRPNSFLRQLVTQAATFTTVTRDEGELHPWSTWPTLHRGVYNTEHKITFINQAIETDFAPIWTLLADHGTRCGVFGSLQSYPYFDANPQRFAFYVPDTFSPNEKSWPRRYEAFQRFNLAMTKQDGAYAKPLKMGTSTLKDLLGMGLSGLKPTTMATLGRHLIRERRQPLYKTRRATLQAPVAFDFLWHALRRDEPQFATFFTNHVAGIMHRYWKYSFPEDFEHVLSGSAEAFKQQSLIAALDIADTQLGRLNAWCEARGATLLVASSMGQEAIERGVYRGEWRIEDPEAFIERLGFTGQATSQLAMQPDFAFSFEDETRRVAFEAAVSTLTLSDGRPLFRVKRVGTTLNLNLSAAKETDGEVVLQTRVDDTPVESVLSSWGIDRFERDPGTGYHQPKGIFLAKGPDIDADAGRSEIELTQLAPTILSRFGAPIPDYMPSPLAL
jgi:hypothetical protein